MIDKSKTLIEIIEANAKKQPQKTALVLAEREITYEGFFIRIGQWVDFLKNNGVKSGDRILIISDDRYDFLAAWLSIWKVGAVAIPLEPTIAPEELSRCIDVAYSKWIISANINHRSVIESHAKIIKNDIKPEWIIAQTDLAQDIDSIKNGSFYIYTSGTTGTPKCVMYDQQTATAIIASLVEAYQLTSDDVVCTPLTPALSATLITGILPGLASGGTLVLPSEPVPGRVLKLIKQHKVTIFFAVPYFYSLLIDSMQTRQDADWSSVRLCLSTSAFLPQKIFEGFHKLTQLPIRSIYCTSEANQCTFNTSTDLDLLKISVGLPQSGVQIKIVNDNGDNVSAGEEGQIIVSGTHLSKGYFRRPDLEAKVYKNGWIYTGDLGFMDKNGYLYITGRLSDTINVSGHLVNPQEVENILSSHPSVKEALILGEFVDQVGEKVVGWAVLKEGCKATQDELINFCKDKLIHYKIPSSINFVDQLPKSRYGKIKRLTPITEQMG